MAMSAPAPHGGHEAGAGDVRGDAAGAALAEVQLDVVTGRYVDEVPSGEGPVRTDWPRALGAAVRPGAVLAHVGGDVSRGRACGDLVSGQQRPTDVHRDAVGVRAGRVPPRRVDLGVEVDRGERPGTDRLPRRLRQATQVLVRCGPGLAVGAGTVL